MRKLLLLCLLIVSTHILFSQVRVSGYTRKNGTYVQPYMRSSPNSNPYDNYSFPGNTNPYTGKTSTGNPDTYLDNYYNRRNNNNNIDYSNTGLLKDVNPYMGIYNYTDPNPQYKSNTTINNIYNYPEPNPQYKSNPTINNTYNYPEPTKEYKSNPTINNTYNYPETNNYINSNSKDLTEWYEKKFGKLETKNNSNNTSKDLTEWYEKKFGKLEFNHKPTNYKNINVDEFKFTISTTFEKIDLEDIVNLLQFHHNNETSFLIQKMKLLYRSSWIKENGNFIFTYYSEKSKYSDNSNTGFVMFKNTTSPKLNDKFKSYSLMEINVDKQEIYKTIIELSERDDYKLISTKNFNGNTINTFEYLSIEKNKNFLIQTIENDLNSKVKFYLSY